MSRNLKEISVKGIAIDAGICLYGIVICLAIIHDNTWLWILSIAGSLAIITLHRLSQQDADSTINRARILRRAQRQTKAGRRRIPPPSAFQRYVEEPNKHVPLPPSMSADSHMRSGIRLRQDWQLVLLHTPPICLN